MSEQNNFNVTNNIADLLKADSNNLQEYLQAHNRNTEIKSRENVQIALLEKCADVLKAGADVWSSYINLDNEKERTKQMAMTHQKDLASIQADLEKSHLSHKEFMERTLDIRTMLKITEERIQPLAKLLDKMIERDDILENVERFTATMHVHGKINELLISLHRFMETR